MSDAQNENIVVEPENKLSYKVRVDRQVYATLLSPENIKSTLSLHPDSIVNRQIQPTAVNGNSYRYDAQFGSNEIISNYMVETFDLTLKIKVRTYKDNQTYNMTVDPAHIYPTVPVAINGSIKLPDGQPRVFVPGVSSLCPNPLDTMTQTIKVTFGQNGNPFTTALTPSIVDAQLRLASKNCLECYNYCPLKLDNCKYFKDRASELYNFTNDGQFGANANGLVSPLFFVPKGTRAIELANLPDNVLGTVGYNRGKFSDDTTFTSGGGTALLTSLVDGIKVPMSSANPGQVWYSEDADWLIETVVFKGLMIPINSPVLKQWMESERPLHNITRMSIERQLYSTPQWVLKSIIPENEIPITQYIHSTAGGVYSWQPNKCISLFNTQCSIDVSVSNQSLTVKVLTLPNTMRTAPICTIPYCQPDITTRQSNVTWAKEPTKLQSDSIPINRVPEFLMVFVEDGDMHATGDKSVKHNVSQGSRAVIERIEISFLNDPLICATYSREQLYHIARENGLHQYDWNINERTTISYVGSVRQPSESRKKDDVCRQNWLYPNYLFGIDDSQSLEKVDCHPLGTIVLLKFGKDIPLRNLELTNSVNVNTSLQVNVYCNSTSNKGVAILNVIRFGYKRAFIDFAGNVTDMETAYVAQNVIDAYKSVSEKQSNNILTVNDRVLMGGAWFSGTASKISEFYPQVVPYIRKALQLSGIHNKVSTEAAIIKNGLNTVGNLTGNKTAKKSADFLRDLGF